MECPYCKGNMQKGYIGLGKEHLVWTPYGSLKSPFNNLPNDEEVVLAKLNYLKGCKCKAYRCPTCKIQIIDENDKQLKD